MIRPITLRDALPYWRTHNTPDFTRMTGSWSYPFGYAEVCERIREAMRAGPGEKQWYTIVEKRNFAGTVVLFAWRPDSVEIGYSIAPSHAGRGIASEAVRAMCEHVFRTYRVKTIRARVGLENPASLRILEKAGFARDPEIAWGWVRHYGRSTPHYNLTLEREGFHS